MSPMVLGGNSGNAPTRDAVFPGLKPGLGVDCAPCKGAPPAERAFSGRENGSPASSIDRATGTIDASQDGAHICLRMTPSNTRHLLFVLAAAIIGCSEETAPAQPPAQPAPVAPLTKLTFLVQPTSAPGAEQIAPAVQVAVQDSAGNTLTTATDAVTLALGANLVAGTLAGTLTVVAARGIATFNNCGSTGRAAVTGSPRARWGAPGRRVPRCRTLTSPA